MTDLIAVIKNTALKNYPAEARKRQEFEKGAVHAAKHYYGYWIGGNPNPPEDRRFVPNRQDITDYVRNTYHLSDAMLAAFLSGAQWLLDEYMPTSGAPKPEPTLRINSGADGWSVMRDSTVLFTFNPKITMAEALEILTKLRS